MTKNKTLLSALALVFFCSSTLLLVACGKFQSNDGPFELVNWTNEFLGTTKGQFADGNGRIYSIFEDGSILRNDSFNSSGVLMKNESGDYELNQFQDLPFSPSSVEVRFTCEVKQPGQISIVNKVRGLTSLGKHSSKLQKTLTVSPRTKFLLSGIYSSTEVTLKWMNPEDFQSLKGLDMELLRHQALKKCKQGQTIIDDSLSFEWPLYAFSKTHIHLLSEIIKDAHEKANYESPMSKLSSKILVSTNSKEADVTTQMFAILDGIHAELNKNGSTREPNEDGVLYVSFAARKRLVNIGYSGKNKPGLKHSCNLSLPTKVSHITFQPNNPENSQLIMKLEPKFPKLDDGFCLCKCPFTKNRDLIIELENLFKNTRSTAYLTAKFVGAPSDLSINFEIYKQDGTGPIEFFKRLGHFSPISSK